MCGLISQYNATEPYGVNNFQSILTNRIKVQGFIVSDRLELALYCLHHQLLKNYVQEADGILPPAAATEHPLRVKM